MCAYDKEWKLIWTDTKKVVEQEWIPFKMLSFQSNKQWYWVFSCLCANRKVVNQVLEQIVYLACLPPAIAPEVEHKPHLLQHFLCWYPCNLPSVSMLYKFLFPFFILGMTYRNVFFERACQKKKKDEMDTRKGYSFWKLFFINQSIKK